MAYSPFKIESCGISDIGPVREENQDSIFLAENFSNNRAALFVVADGMGGYSNGKFASSQAIDTFCETFQSTKGSPAQRLNRGVEVANYKIFQITQKMGVGKMGTTLTAIYIEGKEIIVAHVGDSRAYLMRSHKVCCLTRDHTMVGDLVRMKVISPEKIRTHTQRSVLTRGVGLAPIIHADLTHHDIKEDDKLILCSDGLWSVIEDEELPKISEHSSGISSMVNQLLHMAIERGTDDNISVIGVHIQNLSTDALSKKRNGWHRIRSMVKPS